MNQTKEQDTKEKVEKNECCCEKKQTKDKKEKHEKCHKLEKEIEKLKQEVEEKETKIKYAQAELINYRKRKEDEVASYKKYCHQDLISELIPILDDFEKAIPKNLDALSEEMKKYFTGFTMMKTSLWEALKKFGVEEINNVGKPFNPQEEEALMTESNNELEDDTVIEVLLKGYKLKDRVIRPASVKINKKDE